MRYLYSIQSPFVSCKGERAQYTETLIGGQHFALENSNTESGVKAESR